MKWYKITEFNPPISTQCLISTINTMYYVARLESTDTPDVWLSHYFCNDCGVSDYYKINNVTHFALIEPTQI